VTEPVWQAGGYLYLTVGVVGHGTVADDVVELPQDATGAGRLLALDRVAAQRVRRTADDRWVTAGPSRLVGTTVREAAQPRGARVSGDLAAKLGVDDRDVLRLRAPTWREVAGQQERRSEVRESVGAAVVAVIALAGAVVSATTGDDGVSWPGVVVAVLAFLAATTLAWLRFRAAVRNG
jgi:hypothetical protein